MHRFFVPGADRADVVVGLPDDEARHLTQVLRLGPGDAVRVFDGHGHEHTAVVADAGRAGVRVRTGCAVPAPPEPGVRVTLGAALLKGRKVDAVVRDATMLGVHAIQPLVTLRTEVPARRFGAAAAERWTRIASPPPSSAGARSFRASIHRWTSAASWRARAPAPASACCSSSRERRKGRRRCDPWPESPAPRPP